MGLTIQGLHSAVNFLVIIIQQSPVIHTTKMSCTGEETWLVLCDF